MADQVVVISGGGTGIGAATARMLTRRGAAVVLLGRRAEPLERTAAELGATASWHSVDLTEPDEVERVAEAIGADHPTVDAIVNNAGGSTTIGTTLADKKASWIDIYDKNLISSMLLTTALDPLLRRPGGRIVNVGSMAGQLGGGEPAYVAAKGAVHAWTKALTYQFSPAGITANAVLPGYTPDTELFGDGLPPDVHESILARVPLGRTARADDVAGMIAYLVSPEASFVANQIIEVNGAALPPVFS
jgi:3-oxoacyl-[acyl-carrier protein] reductase